MISVYCGMRTIQEPTALVNVLFVLEKCAVLSSLFTCIDLHCMVDFHQP